jgi:hypothetical protein
MLLSVLTEIWPFLIPFLSALLSAAVGYWVARQNRAATETTKEKETREKLNSDAKAATEARLVLLEKNQQEMREAFAERKQTADAARMLDKLNYDKDFATITEILKEGAQTTKQTVGILANIGHLQQGQQRNEQEIREVNKRVERTEERIYTLTQHHAQQRNP